MSHTRPLLVTPSCIIPDIQPVLTELQQSVSMHVCGEAGTKRAVFEQFIHQVFKRAYGAELHSYYPRLLAFTSGVETRGVVGYRDGMAMPLFSEQYLDAAAERVIGVHLDQDIDRRELVEVGNLALAGPGEVRWVIAAMTVFLYAAGYRWVLFTAVKSLYNAFQRLGLKPIQIAKPNPERLPDGGNNWGSYYQAGPLVCAGDIAAGYRKLIAFISQRPPQLSAMLEEAFFHGLKTRFVGAGKLDKAG